MEMNEKMKENLVYAIVGLTSAGLLLLSIVLHTSNPDIASFCKELGIAGVIALIVIFTIEKFTRERHESAANTLVERMNKNLFHAIYKRHIPEVVFAEVEKCLMNTGIFRTQHDLVYTITKFEEGAVGIDFSRHVKCEAASTYKLRNVADRPIKHDVTMVLELPIDESWNDHVKILKVKIDGQELSVAEITDKTTKSDSQMVFRHPITLKVGEEVDVSVQAVLVKEKKDQEVWASRLPSDGLKLTVNTPDRDITVNAHANHSEKLKLESENNIAKKWSLNYGIFPYQSIAFWWS